MLAIRTGEGAAVMVEEFCAYGECDRPAFVDGLCVGHFKQKQRYGRVVGPLQGQHGAMSTHQDVFDQVIDAFAALQIAAENGESHYGAAKRRFRYWARRWICPQIGPNTVCIGHTTARRRRARRT